MWPAPKCGLSQLIKFICCNGLKHPSKHWLWISLATPVHFPPICKSKLPLRPTITKLLSCMDQLAFQINYALFCVWCNFNCWTGIVNHKNSPAKVCHPCVFRSCVLLIKITLLWNLCFLQKVPPLGSAFHLLGKYAKPALNMICFSFKIFIYKVCMYSLH